MASIPQDPYLDSTLPFISTGYPFLQHRFKKLQTDIFQMRLLGEKTIAIHGEEAAKIFYDTDRFRRKDAVPKRIQKSLFGLKGVQSLDGEAHRHRKEMFMSLMSEENMQHLMELTARQWESYLLKWKGKDQLIVLFEEAQEVLCRAACEWAGIPLKEEEVKYRTEELAARIDSFGGVGPRYWRGLLARIKTERWIKGIVEQVRKGQLEVPKESAVYVFAHHQDPEGRPLDSRTAAVELLNVIRPYVAVAYFVAFSALALHQYPEQRRKLQEEGAEYAHLFVQEVRRFYPFVPLLGARVRKEFGWRGHRFKEGRLVVLDVYGLLHDENKWKNATTFKPERFRDWKGSPFDFIPQGGGDHYHNHRCAGEWITIGAAKVSLQFLAALRYEVPKQNLKVSLGRMPVYPKSGFIISKVRSNKMSVEVGASPISTADRKVANKNGGCPYHHQQEENSAGKERE